MADPFADTQAAQINNASLAYLERGEGDPLVLVHGSASDLRTWHNQLSALSADYRVIAYSRRYARPNERISVAADDPMQPHADDLAAFLKETKAAPAHVVGHSWGGFVALLAAMQNPGLFRSLVLIEPPVLPLFMDSSPKPGQVLRLFATRPRTAIVLLKFGIGVIGRAAKAFRRSNDDAATEILGRGILGDRYFDRLSDERLEQIWDNRDVDRAQTIGVGFPPLDPRMVSSLSLPVLLIAGKDSPPLFGCLTRRLHELLPNARIVHIDNASHIAHEDNPEMVNSHIKRFLEAV